MPKMFQHSVVVRSGQAWKLMTFLAGASLTLLGLFTALFASVALSETGRIVMLLGSVSLGIGSSAFLALALICPRCRTRWAWWQMRHGSGVDVFGGLMLLRKCPACDFPADGANVRRETASPHGAP
jgi:hypothetical protein